MAWLAAAGWTGAGLAQTAEQQRQMEYERQQREYWRAQEAARIEETRRMNEQIRLQQEREAAARREKDSADAARRRDEQWEQDSKAAKDRQQQSLQSSQGQAAQLEAARQSWLKKPPLPKESNPLLGRWMRPASTRPTSNDPFAQLGALARGGVCELFFGGGGVFEFRPTTLVGSDANTREQVLDQVEYRGDAKRVVVIPKQSFKLIEFDFEGPDRITWQLQNCTLVRAGAAQAAAPATARVAAGTATAGAAAPSAAAPGAVNGAVMNLAATIGAVESARPAANTVFIVLRHSAEVALRQKGFQPRTGMSVLKSWTLECRQKSEACKQGALGLGADGLGTFRTDAQGKAQTPPIPPGTYYLFGSVRQPDGEVYWNVRVDLKPGVNAITLDQRSATPPL